MKLKSNDLDLRLGRNSYFKISKKFAPNLGENEEQIDLKTEIEYLNLI